jgi:hypothetical protein
MLEVAFICLASGLVLGLALQKYGELRVLRTGGRDVLDAYLAFAYQGETEEELATRLEASWLVGRTRYAAYSLILVVLARAVFGLARFTPGLDPARNSTQMIEWLALLLLGVSALLLAVVASREARFVLAESRGGRGPGR